MLTDKQRRFVKEYLIDSNALQAALRAGYSQSTALKASAMLLKKPDVKMALDAERRNLEKKLDVTREKVVQEWASLAFADRKDIEMAGKTKALDALSRILGLYEKDNQQTTAALTGGAPRDEVAMLDVARRLHHIFREAAELKERKQEDA